MNSEWIVRKWESGKVSGWEGQPRDGRRLEHCGGDRRPKSKGRRSKVKSGRKRMEWDREIFLSQNGFFAKRTHRGIDFTGVMKKNEAKAKPPPEGGTPNGDGGGAAGWI